VVEERHPGNVPDEDGGQLECRVGVDTDVSSGFDTDGDERPDTVVTDDGVDLILLTDLDGDGLADQVLRIGPDGVVREAPGPMIGPGDGVVDGLLGGAEAGSGPRVDVPFG